MAATWKEVLFCSPWASSVDTDGDGHPDDVVCPIRIWRRRFRRTAGTAGRRGSTDAPQSQFAVVGLKSHTGPCDPNALIQFEGPAPSAGEQDKGHALHLPFLSSLEKD